MLGLATYLDTTLLLSIALLFADIYVGMQIDLKKDKNKYMILATLLLVVQVMLCGAFTACLVNKGSENLAKILLSAITLNGALVSIYVMFYTVNYLGESKISKRLLYLMFIPFALQVYNLVENYITESAFGFVDGKMVFGPMIILHGGVLCANMVIWFVIALVNRHKFKGQEKKIHGIIFIAVICSMIGALFHQNVLIFWNTIELIMLVYFILMQETVIENDSLTKAMLLKYFLEQRLPEIVSKEKKVIVAFLDIDSLTGINKTFGIKEGDNVLQTMVEKIHSCITSEDMVVRYKGDKFLIILQNKEIEEARKIYSSLRSTIQKYNGESYKKYDIDYTLVYKRCDLVNEDITRCVSKLIGEVYNIKKEKIARETI